MAANSSLRLVLATLAVASATAASSQAAARDDCFDARVSARILRQIPTTLPDCGRDCIVMAWPWFMDLRIERVLEGEARRGPLTVLTLQHMRYRTDLGGRRWWLRRNSEGGFNVLRLSDDARPERCAAGSPPAPAYIRGSRPLAEVRREAERDAERQARD